MIRTTTHFLSRTPLLMRVVFLYVLAGCVVWGGGQAITTLTPRPVEARTLPVTSIPKQPAAIKSGTPVRLQVERLGIDLPVKDGTYDPTTNSWSLSDDSAFFATVTAAPNDSHGDTFIYGHNTEAVLAKTATIQLGDRATVTTSNGLTFSYQYVGDTSVTPDKTEILNEDPSTPQLTLMTCEGWWSATRRLMFFTFEGVSP